MSIQKITSLEDFKKFISEDVVSVVFFRTETDVGCQIIGASYPQVIALPDFEKFKCYEVDIEKSRDIMADAEIHRIPTFVIYHKGEKKDERYAPDQNELMSFLAKGFSYQS